MDKFNKAERKLNESNNLLAKVLKRNGISKLRLTSGVNSIASGYSMTRTIMPLLYRNKTIEPIMNINDIELERYHFSRAQNNCDEHFYDWLILNTKESEIMKMNYSDYSNESTSMLVRDLSDQMEMLKETFSNQIISYDKGLQDLLLESNYSLANILVYNGATGSFLDNNTRGGKLSQRTFYGIKRDLTSIESTLKFIQANNRKNESKTQVYLCGAPKILCFSELINKDLKKISSKYANTTYVESVSTKLIYKRLDNNKYGIDIHYDEIEYLKLYNNIINSIINNYAPNDAMIEIDRELTNMSKHIEIKRHDLNGNNEYINKFLKYELEINTSILKSKEEFKNFSKKYENYLKTRIPYDFYYLGKQNIENSISKCKKMIK